MFLAFGTLYGGISIMNGDGASGLPSRFMAYADTAAMTMPMRYMQTTALSPKNTDEKAR